MEKAKLLDAAAKKTGSDYQTAKRLKTSTALLSKWRKDGTPAPDMAAALAELSGADPIKATLESALAHSRNEAGQESIRRAIKKYAAKATKTLGAALLASVLTAPTDSHAQFNNSQINAPAIHIIALLRRLAATVRAMLATPFRTA